MELSVIIVSYNVKAYLEQCLRSLERATRSVAAEVWVVDNASIDGTAAWLPGAFPWVRLMALEENLGFARANNRALAEVRGKYVLFLNPDTLLEEDGLEKCVAFLERQPDAGALGVRMVNGFGTFLPESKRGMPGVSASLYKMMGLADRYPKSQRYARYYMGHLPERQTNPVPVLAGAFMMIPRQVLDETGGFDERFFMFGEDIDLSYRIRQTGRNNYYFPETTIIHFKGQSTDKEEDAYLDHFYGAMTLFVRKYYRGPWGALYRGLIQTGIRVQKLKARLRPPKPRHFTPQTARKHQFLVVGSGADTKAFLKEYEVGGELYIRNIDTDVQPVSTIRHHQSFTGGLPVLFCLGGLTFSRVIEWFGRTEDGPPGFFHYMQSDSIIGPGKEWPVPFRRK